MPVGNRLVIRLMGLLTAVLFLLSAVLNFGARIPLGLAELSFSSPLMSTGEIEVVIGLALIASVVFSRLYGYGGAYLLALVGIVSGLLSPDVQGLARSLHEAMLPVALVGCVFLLLEARDAYRSGAHQPSGQLNRGLVTALQFFVGGLVILGGVGYAASATYPVGTSLGLIHLAVGLAALFGGFAFYRRKTWSRGFLIAINVVTVAYSAFSEGAAQVYSLLPPGIGDALIGTIVAIAVSVVIIYQLLSRSN